MSTRPLSYVRYCWYLWRKKRNVSDFALHRKKLCSTLDVQFLVTGKFPN